MKRIVIWGLGTEWERIRKLIESKELLLSKDDNKDSFEIVAYCDRDEEKKAVLEDGKKFISPNEVLQNSPDLVLTTNKLKPIILASEAKYEVQTYCDFVKARLDVHEKAVGNGFAMYKTACEIYERTNLIVKNVFEIGANYGQDAEFFRLFFGLRPEDVYTFEAHPVISKEISKRYHFNNYHYAVSDKIGKVKLHAVDENDANSGISSIMEFGSAKQLNTIEVDCITMNHFLKNNPEIESLDILKIDVEGVNGQVLLGFGDEISKVKCVHVEAERIKEFDGHLLFNDIASFFINNGFELVYYKLFWNQSDSLWIKKELLKNDREAWERIKKI